MDEIIFAYIIIMGILLLGWLYDSLKYFGFISVLRLNFALGFSIYSDTFPAKDVDIDSLAAAIEKHGRPAIKYGNSIYCNRLVNNNETAKKKKFLRYQIADERIDIIENAGEKFICFTVKISAIKEIIPFTLIPFFTMIHMTVTPLDEALFLIGIILLSMVLISVIFIFLERKRVRAFSGFLRENFEMKGE